ncbi:MAG: flagellar hook-length control protein FliK [Methylobacteriaceae bacterium]|nr:flagellar hook-length control protein FliK [Methylobacteriaceae bacterium]
MSFEARQGGERAAPSRADAPSLADADVAALAAAPDLASAVETHLLPARWPQTVERIVAAADEARAAAAAAPAAPDAPPRPAMNLLRLTLEPERLGAVTVTLRLRGDALEARLATERPETAALLEGRRAELSDALRRAGYEIEQWSFTPAPPAVEPARRGEAAREAAQERREPGEQRRDDGAQDDGGRRGDRGSQEDRDARRRWRGLRRDDLDAG